MCGRFGLNISWNELLDWIDPDVAKSIQSDEYEGKKECFPSQSLPVVLPYRSGRIIRVAEWGIKRNWSKRSIINLQLEKIKTNTFSPLYRGSRLVVPATHFYEWKDKERVHIELKGEKMFAFAGVWEKQEQSGKFAILTYAANSSISGIHDRMPVMIKKEKIGEWLSGKSDLSEVFDAESIEWKPDFQKTRI